MVRGFSGTPLFAGGRKLLATLATVGLLSSGLVLSATDEASASDCGTLNSDDFHEITSSAQLAQVGSGGTGTGSCGLGAKYLVKNDFTAGTHTHLSVTEVPPSRELLMAAGTRSRG